MDSGSEHVRYLCRRVPKPLCATRAFRKRNDNNEDSAGFSPIKVLCTLIRKWRSALRLRARRQWGLADGSTRVLAPAGLRAWLQSRSSPRTVLQGHPPAARKRPPGPGSPAQQVSLGFFLSLVGATDVVAINVWENCSLARDLEKANKK